MSNMSKGKTMKVYGITGSIACGKSTVTHYLIERGYLVVDADLISRNALTIDQECILKVQELFGCVKDGIVDRKALGRIVFHDKNAKKQLEAIIHPYVILKMKEEIEKNKERDCIFLDIPLLYESHLEYLCDEIIVVYLDEQRQVQRLMARDHIDESYAYTIINNQISSLKKREMADIVFDNNQGIEELYKQIDEFIESCKFQPLSATKIIVNKEEIEELLRELRLKTPDEIKRYQKIISNKDAILEDAQSKADAIIADAQAKAQELVTQHEIMQKAYAQANDTINAANKQAQEILDSATQDANSIRLSAITYTDDMMANIGSVLNQTLEDAGGKYKGFIDALQSCLDVVNHNRQELAPQTAQAAAMTGSYHEEPADAPEFNRSRPSILYASMLLLTSSRASLPTLSASAP